MESDRIHGNLQSDAAKPAFRAAVRMQRGVQGRAGDREPGDLLGLGGEDLETAI